MMHSRWIVCPVVALVVMAASCSSGAKKAAPTTVATSTTAVGATSTSRQAGPPVPVTTTVKAGPTTTTTLNSNTCRTNQLTAALTNTNGAAGTVYSHLTFTNKSALICVMSGFPGVSFIDKNGKQIGAPAGHLVGYGGTVTLAPGGLGAAVFAYHSAYVGTSPACGSPVPATALKVYPPGETTALQVPDATMACSSPAATGVAEVGSVVNPASLPS